MTKTIHVVPSVLADENTALRRQLAELRRALEQQRDITKDFLEHGLWKEEDKASELRFYIQNMLTHQYDAMVATLARVGGGEEEAGE